MLCLTFLFFLTEIIFGYITNSLALIGDSYHMLSDVIALIVGFTALRVRRRRRFVIFSRDSATCEPLDACRGSAKLRVFHTPLVFQWAVENAYIPQLNSVSRDTTIGVGFRMQVARHRPT